MGSTKARVEFTTTIEHDGTLADIEKSIRDGLAEARAAGAVESPWLVYLGIRSKTTYLTIQWEPVPLREAEGR